MRPLTNTTQKMKFPAKDFFIFCEVSFVTHAQNVLSSVEFTTRLKEDREK